MVLVHLEGECRALRILWYGVSSRLSAFGEEMKLALTSLGVSVAAGCGRSSDQGEKSKGARGAGAEAGWT